MADESWVQMNIFFWITTLLWCRIVGQTVSLSSSVNFFPAFSSSRKCAAAARPPWSPDWGRWWSSALVPPAPWCAHTWSSSFWCEVHSYLGFKISSFSIKQKNHFFQLIIKSTGRRRGRRSELPSECWSSCDCERTGDRRGSRTSADWASSGGGHRESWCTLSAW